jgi:hypothetical protein
MLLSATYDSKFPSGISTDRRQDSLLNAKAPDRTKSSIGGSFIAHLTTFWESFHDFPLEGWVHASELPNLNLNERHS